MEPSESWPKHVWEITGVVEKKLLGVTQRLKGRHEGKYIASMNRSKKKRNGKKFSWATVGSGAETKASTTMKKIR